MNDMRKLMEAVANPPRKQKLTEWYPGMAARKKKSIIESSKMVHVYGDSYGKRVKGAVSMKFFKAWVDMLEHGDNELEKKLHNLLRSKKGFDFYNAFSEACGPGRPDDIKYLRRVLKGGSDCFGNDGTELGMGLTKTAARKAYEENQEEVSGY